MKNKVAAVSKQIDKNNHHFNAYYQDNALLIQLVIVEFISAQKSISQIQLLERQCFKSKESWESALSPLLNHLTQLIGTPAYQDLVGVPSWNKGSLTKLKSYCFQFSKNIGTENKRELALYTFVNQAWLYALQNMDILNTVCLPNNPTAIPKLHQSLNRLYNRSQSISKQILRITSTFRNNENVIFFLCRKRDDLAEIYGSDFFNKIFKKSMKKQEILQMLMEKYSNRGFKNLLNSFNP